MSSREESIQENLNLTLARLDGRAKLLTVSKTWPASDAMIAYNAGQRDFGENKVQDLLEKSLELEELCPDIKWHFIGKLQSNKINQLLKTPNLISIHSIDSIKLLNKLLSKKVDKKVGLFLQYNTSNEEQKSGFTDYDELVKACELTQQSECFYLQGLMTMGSISGEDFHQAAKECFSKLNGLKQSLEKELKIGTLELSMGMSQDFEIALEEGTDWVRVGSAIFGSRSK
ncbi:MAG: YggS family pyridoxal phosphate-dependent enzyme [Bacteriovoracaceae bacterium]|nr:YggS family pyridoxal phosphate-dependent enzyme [Bacteriovoracaceae bacterium]